MDWIEIGNDHDFAEGTANELVVQDRIVAVFRVGGTLFAMDGVCPHQGGPLGKGTLEGCILTCPWHGWQFDVHDGQSRLTPNVRQPTYEVKAEAGRVYVRFGGDA